MQVNFSTTAAVSYIKNNPKQVAAIIVVASVITAVVLIALFSAAQSKANQPMSKPELSPAPDHSTFTKDELFNMSRGDCLNEAKEAQAAVVDYNNCLADLEKKFAAGQITPEHYVSFKQVLSSGKLRASLWENWFLNRADQLIDHNAIYWQALADKVRWPMAATVIAAVTSATGFGGYCIYKHVTKVDTLLDIDVVSNRDL